MNIFETSALVEAEGQVLVTGVPFEPGTQVEVTITPLAQNSPASTEPAERLSQLFAALDKARNTQPVGPLRREELYDRRVLR